MGPKCKKGDLEVGWRNKSGKIGKDSIIQDLEGEVRKFNHGFKAKKST